MRILGEKLTIAPVKIYEAPRYPTLAVHTTDPAFAVRYIPRSWATKNVTLGLLAAYTLSGSAVIGASGDAIAGTQPTAEQGQTTKNRDPEQSTSERASIAPVFIHGNGRGATGCVVIGGPVFLSEDEAIEIVRAELERGGLSFEERDRLLPGMEWDQPLVRDTHFPGDDMPLPTAKRPFTVELYDAKLKLAVKVLTAHNYELSGGGLSRSTVADWDLLCLAQKTVERLQASSSDNAVVFYDPLEYGGPFGNEREAGIARAREQLRAQVQDFLLWLKARGKGTGPRD